VGVSGSRREMLRNALLAASVVLTTRDGIALAAGKAATRTAGDFLPPSGTEGFSLYVPDSRATPAIRAGVIKDSYSFEIPSKWSESTILNILSGNFCMPKCDEPWIESVFESPTEGKAFLYALPLRKLVSKSNATLKDVGDPELLVERIGGYITGTYLDVDDVKDIKQQEFSDGRQYYTFEAFAPYAKEGAHSLSAFTVKVNDLLVHCFYT
jgi:hypothetical protein